MGLGFRVGVLEVCALGFGVAGIGVLWGLVFWRSGFGSWGLFFWHLGSKGFRGLRMQR